MPAKQGGNTIGRDIYIKGEVTGSEELVVEGQIEGAVHLRNHLLIAEGAVIVADVNADAITVHGEVRGNLVASNRVDILASARVSGDVKAPQVYLADGARFKGAIEMEVPVPREF
ncbi:MAG: polymer-forming cytoskeletal protein [Myxococcota bacterium]